ncbi:unnamed protein product [Caenorhabditis angaria]|uniref:Domain of unknown function DX domain-containing protein n=1 Tax=Caenorhabditis angaria TaxID=860376 RepID=A0A9P1ICW7_9PELO|nr:unnamed protein product [Caenorhabditis angaria]
MIALKNVSNIIFLIFIFAWISGGICDEEPEKCPDGGAPHFYDNYKKCFYNKKLLFYFDRFVKYGCCEDPGKACKVTGTAPNFSALILGTGNPLYNINISMWSGNEKFVYDNNGQQGYICPIPVGYFWFDSLEYSEDEFEKKHLPVDYVGMNSTTPLKSCSNNIDCNYDEICSPFVSYESDGKNKFNNGLINRDVKFCYFKPPITNATTARSYRYLTHPSQIEAFFCLSDNDCMKNENWNSKCENSKEKWTYFDESLQHKKQYAGFCVEMKPLPYTFSIPTKDDQINLPIDYEESKSVENLKKCETNNDCNDGNGQKFCDYSIGYEDDITRNNSDKFCYKVPDYLAKLPEKTVLEEKALSFKLCNNSSHCKSSAYCYKPSGNQERFKADGKVYEGYCVLTKMCPFHKVPKQAYGVGFCETDDDCPQFENRQKSYCTKKHGVGFCCMGEFDYTVVIESDYTFTYQVMGVALFVGTTCLCLLIWYAVSQNNKEAERDQMRKYGYIPGKRKQH